MCDREDFWSCENNDVEKELSLFDVESKESGFCEYDDDEEFLTELNNSDLDIENTIVEFLPDSPLNFDRENHRKALRSLSDNRDNQLVSNNNKNQEEIIKKAVEKSNNDFSLIGDFSKSCILPILGKTSNPDLKNISVVTVKNLLEGKYKNQVDSYQIIDCRYPYEYYGGHIKGAVNFYRRENCLNTLFRLPAKPDNERHILIFHCEFSMERGPNMLRALREEDRLKNVMNYPKLMYPEIYILTGGYKEFFMAFPECCEPQGYKRMIHPQHATDLRKFRKKSKSFELSKSRQFDSKLRKFYSDSDIQ